MNESVLSSLTFCARGCSCGCGLSGFQGQSTVHGLWQVRTVVGARTRAGCTCAEEGGKKGARCVSIKCCISLDWAHSKRSVEKRLNLKWIEESCGGTRCSKFQKRYISV